MAALCVVIYQLHGVLLAACESPDRAFLSYAMPDLSLMRSIVLLLWNTRVVVMLMMLTMRCITSALDGTMCSRLRYEADAVKDYLHGKEDGLAHHLLTVGTHASFCVLAL